MHLFPRSKYLLASIVLAVSVMVLAVLVPSQGADAVDGPVEVVFVARSDEFADALAGGPLAALRNAPILLTQTSSLDAKTAAELDRLDPERIIILGGPVAISDATEDQMQAYAGAGGVTRIAGGDRFETAAKIAQQLPNKAADADLLDGMDSTEFLGSSAKAADSELLDGMEASDFAPASMATMATPYTVQLELGTYAVIGTSGPLTLAAFCEDEGDTTPQMYLAVSTTEADSYSQDLGGQFGPADGWTQFIYMQTPGPDGYYNTIDGGVAVARVDDTVHAISVDGESAGYGEDIFGQTCTMNGIVNTYSAPAGLTAGAEPIPAP